jgi:hypothetical protein
MLVGKTAISMSLLMLEGIVDGIAFRQGLMRTALKPVDRLLPCG